jgi:hypothetical protein
VTTGPAPAGEAATAGIAAEADAGVRNWLAGKQVTDVRFVPGRMVVFKTR